MEQGKVEMRSRGVSRGSDIAHHLALPYVLALAHGVSAQMSVERGISVSDGDLDAVSVAAIPGSHGDDAVRNGIDRSYRRQADINSSVEDPRTEDRVDTVSIRRRDDTAVHRPPVSRRAG